MRNCSALRCFAIVVAIATACAVAAAGRDAARRRAARANFFAPTARGNNNGNGNASASFDDCPSRCVCFAKAVRCMFQSLNRIPRVSPNTTVLDLRFNKISEIRPGTFHELERLETLLLNDNELRVLRANAFAGLKNLRILYLYKNRLETIGPGTFDGLAKLEQLYLHHNRLREIKKDTFRDLPRLERLFLHNNKLRRVPDEAFVNVGPMTRLRLDSNALVCDCDLVWLVERMRDKSGETAAICQSPDEMQGRSINSMSVKDFHCEMPKIMVEPEDVTVRIGETAIFVCRVAGNPKPRVKWMKDSSVMRMEDERCVVRDDGSLVINQITENDAGEYECIAQSKMGTTVSRKARAIFQADHSVHFVEIPMSQTVRAGDDVVLACSAVSDPPPEIQWWRNGQRIVPGPRFLMDNADGTILRIISVEIRDTARYVCRARFGLDYGEVSADLTVLSTDASPPRMTYLPPETLEAEIGASLEIPCRARGDPKPVITWKKDGSGLELGTKYRVSRGGSLYVYEARPGDAGRYECTATNEHGRASAQCLLRLRQSSTSDVLIARAFHDAEASVDRAINQTLASLFGLGSAPPSRDPFKVIRFPNAAARAAARPAEIFERTIANVRRYIDQNIAPVMNSSFRYEDILSEEQIADIERLSGCTGHRRIPNCDENMCYHSKYRSIDGTCNNLRNPTWGSSYTGFRRLLQPIYENGFSTPIGWTPGRLYYGHPKPPARLVSTRLIGTHHITSDEAITHMVMQWGQFLDHDLDHALPSVSSESWDGIDCKKSCDNAAPCFPMEVPPDDPRINNRRCIDFVRTSAVCGSGMTSVLWGEGFKPREQMNQLTAYLDASQVYGYNDELARDLRDLGNDRGLLRESPGIPGRKSMLPYASGQFVDCRRDPLESSINCFVAGDIRANEQVGLLAMHTLWLREHNRVARYLGAVNRHWSGEKIYQESRKIIGAQMQHISYEHWLPKILGHKIADYKNYDDSLDPGISNVFATAALRFGHSMIQPQLARLNENFSSIVQGPLNLRDAFFSPWRLVDEGGVDPLLRGMFATPAKLKLPEENLNLELTEQLFRTAHAVALDLAAMNIQRSRDHGIPGYLDWRRYCNMSVANSFDDLETEISSTRVRDKLREIYGHPGNVDVWVGGILEDQLPGAKVGKLFHCLLQEQFLRTRDADRFWYQRPGVFKDDQLSEIKRTSLAAILCENGDNVTRLQPDVFLLPDQNGYVSCDLIPRLDLRKWIDCRDTCAEDTGNSITRVRRHADIYLEPLNRPGAGNESIVGHFETQIEMVMDETARLKKRAAVLEKKIAELKTQLEMAKKSPGAA